MQWTRAQTRILIGRSCDVFAKLLHANGFGPAAEVYLRRRLCSLQSCSQHTLQGSFPRDMSNFTVKCIGTAAKPSSNYAKRSMWEHDALGLHQGLCHAAHKKLHRASCGAGGSFCEEAACVRFQLGPTRRQRQGSSDEGRAQEPAGLGEPAAGDQSGLGAEPAQDRGV